MATLPSATTRVDDESGGLSTGTDLLTVFAPVATLDELGGQARRALAGPAQR
jgi:hypothetical protein